jgi:hypothetical protein
LCNIHAGEQGQSIGSVYGKTIREIREERKVWFDKTDCFNDAICKKNCLDVCIEIIIIQLNFVAVNEPRMAS